MQEVIWAQKYRPASVEETILPEKTKGIFQKYVDEGSVPQNMILSGGAGVGKTTAAKAVLEEIGCDYIIINGSLNGNIDTLRHEIATFASTTSFVGGRKYVILDEADYLSNKTQVALRNFMEEYSKNCGFILTCNYLNKVIDPLRSRCSLIEFSIPKAEKPELMKQFLKRIMYILDENGVSYKPKVLGEVMKLYFPDFRKMLNELQFYASSGEIDEGILANKNKDNLNALIEFMKDRDFTNVRKWVAENSDIESNILYHMLYEMLPGQLKSPVNVAQCIITLAEYDYKEAFVANPEINRTAALAQLMVDAEWKNV